MKVKIHLCQPPIPTPSSSQCPSRITIVSSLVLILLKISMLHIYILKIYNFKRNQTDTHCSRACFFQCNIFMVRTYGSNLIFLSDSVWMCPRLFCDSSGDIQAVSNLWPLQTMLCCTSLHTYADVSLGWYQKVEMLGMICTFYTLIDIASVTNLNLLCIYVFIA